MFRKFLALSLIPAFALPAVPQQLPPQTHKLARPAISQSHFDGKSWWDYVKFLADDRLEGRETGSEGLRQAESYVVEQLRKSGLEPAGADGFYQPVQFESRQIVEKDSSAALIHDGKPEPLTLGDDVIFSTRTGLAPDVQAPLVFVGYGLQIPENKIDDFAGLDLHGKIAVYITGSPADVPAALSAHYGSIVERWKPLHDAGAEGVQSVIPNPASMDVPWSRITANRAAPTMHLVGSEFNDTPGLQAGPGRESRQRRDKFFAGSGHTFADLAALAKDRKPLPQFPLAVSIHTVGESRNENSGIRQRNRQAPRHRSEIVCAVRDPLRAHRSPRNRRAHQWRFHLQRRDGQCLRLRGFARRRCFAQKIRTSSSAAR
jgi:hypothetical protein